MNRRTPNGVLISKPSSSRYRPGGNSMTRAATRITPEVMTVSPQRIVAPYETDGNGAAPTAPRATLVLV